MATYDLDGEGALELNEFLQFLRSQHDEAINRLKEMAECPIMCLASKPGERYIPPRRGTLHFKVTDSFQTSDTQRVMSSFDYKNILTLIQSSQLDITEGFIMATKSSKLRLQEASSIYQLLYGECRDKSKVLAMLLPIMLNPKEARSLVEGVVGEDEIEMNKVASLASLIVFTLFKIALSLIYS